MEIEQKLTLLRAKFGEDKFDKVITKLLDGHEISNYRGSFDLNPYTMWIEAQGYTIKDILGKNKKTDLMDVRRCITVYLYQQKKMSVTRIGLVMNRNHSTIIHSITMHEDLLVTGNLAYTHLWTDLMFFTHSNKL